MPSSAPSPQSAAPDLRTPPVRGFSLIEVALAMGVVSFALVAILGLVATVINTSRESRQSTDNAMLFKRVTHQLRIKPFSESQDGAGTFYPLPALNMAGGKTRFFVDSRNEFAGLATDPAPTDAVHIVSVQILDAAVLDAPGMQVPPAMADGRLALVRVEIQAAANHQAGQKTDVKAYVTEVASFDR
jgi:uncharacterized protein (TIGR02598 family)